MTPLPECYPAIPLWILWTVLALWVVCAGLFTLIACLTEGE